MIGNRPRTKTFLLSIACILGNQSCGAGAKAQKPTAGTAANSNIDPMPEPPPEAGQLVMHIDGAIANGSVQGYVVGHQNLKIEGRADGEHFIQNVPPGSFDVVLTARPAETGLVTAPLAATIGIRLGKLISKAGERTSEKIANLPELSFIAGNVEVPGLSDRSGIQVYIPGTDFIAMTDANGDYRLSGVPAGTHNVYFQYAGYYKARLENIVVEAKTPVSLPNVGLDLDTGPEAILRLAGGASISNQLKVTISIGTTNDATLMMLSESSTFLGATWQPLATTTSYTFANPGEKSLYLRLANANGLESAPLKGSITIDLFSDGQKAFMPSFLAPPIAPPSSALAVRNIVVPKAATQMQLSLRNDFSDAAWENVATEKALSLSPEYTSCGNQTVYLKFRTATGFESPVGKVLSKLLCNQAMSSKNAPSARVNHSAVWAKGLGKMIVWGGEGDCGNPCGDGGIYDLATDSWTAIAYPSARRSQHVAVWTGSRMLVWGGRTTATFPSGLAQDVYSYDPLTNSWEQRSASGAPSERWGHVAVWTGDEMLIWGGANEELSTGARYSPSLNRWASLPTLANPQHTIKPCAAWSGSEFLMGLGRGDTPVLSAASWTPTNNWTLVADAPLALASEGQSGLWTGTHFLCFGKAVNGMSEALGLVALNATSRQWSQRQIPGLSSYNIGYSVVWGEGQALFWGGRNSQGLLPAGLRVNLFQLP